MWSIPPLPDVPEELHGETVVFVASLYAGRPEEADARSPRFESSARRSQT